MSIQEKKNLLNIFSSILISGIYFWYVFDSNPLEGLTTDEQLKFWGVTLLIMIPVKIVGMIIIHIVFSISNTIVTQEKEPKKDERDKLIELTSSRNGFIVFSMGFMLAMIALALGKSVNVMFFLFIGFGVLTEITEHLSQFYFYRKGI